MSQTVKKTVSGTTKEGKELLLFRIPNDTGDYVEITNDGCAIQSLCVHDLKGRLQNIAQGAEPIFAGALGKALSAKVWDVADVGDNYVFFSCACTEAETGLGSALKAGARVMWVNRNRLVMDLFLTPEKGVSLPLSTQLKVSCGAAPQVRSFCPQVLQNGRDPVPVEDTKYAAMAFTPASQAADVFLSPSEEIKPMAELADEQTGLYISAYATLPALRLESEPNAVRLFQETPAPIPLQSGESLTERVIYGVDFLPPFPEEPSDEDPESEAEPNPLSVFGLGV